MRSVTLLAAAIVVAVPLLLQAGAGRAELAGLDAAQAMFYNGRYADAISATAELCTPEVAVLPACELRTSALHFQLRRALGESANKEKAFTQCAACAELFSTFVAEIRRGQELARARLKTNAEDEEALFFLGKLDLNYVWLHLATIGRKTGWDEYWEARRSLDAVLKRNPHNVRAKVARAWIDYIVDTKMPRGTRWLLGGGNKKRGLQAVREAATADADMFVRAEAGFALWDMQVRERNMAAALVTARMLAGDFPANPELRKFVDAQAAPTSH